jgi:hypothetical protein
MAFINNRIIGFHGKILLTDGSEINASVEEGVETGTNIS